MNNDVVLINLDKERQLKFTISAMKRLEAKFGKDITEIDADLATKMTSMIDHLIYEGLLYEANENEEELTHEQVLKMLDNAPTVGYLVKKFTEAWKLAWDEDGGNGQPPATEQQASPKNTTGKKTKD